MQQEEFSWAKTTTPFSNAYAIQIRQISHWEVLCIIGHIGKDIP